MLLLLRWTGEWHVFADGERVENRRRRLRHGRLMAVLVTTVVVMLVMVIAECEAETKGEPIGEQLVAHLAHDLDHEAATPRHR